MDFWVLAMYQCRCWFTEAVINQGKLSKRNVNKGQAILNLLATPHSNSLFFNFMMFLKKQSSQEYLAKLGNIQNMKVQKS